MEGFLVGSARVLRRNSTRGPCKVSEAIFFELFCSCKGFETVLLKPQPVSFFSNAWELPISVATTVLGSREVDQRML